VQLVSNFERRRHADVCPRCRKIQDDAASLTKHHYAVSRRRAIFNNGHAPTTTLAVKSFLLFALYPMSQQQ